ncbi:MAG: ABC transporter substrate-binding protein [Ignavibacteriales bacterium]|nr:MAG: ABC transporter substrate-binding protein [Ignavibacteriales bacterium]
MIIEKMKKFWKNLDKLYLAILIILVAVTIYFVRSTAGDEKGTKNISLRLRWLHQTQFAGIYWADQFALFDGYNLSVELRTSGPGVNFIQGVATGNEDFGIAGAGQIVEARDKGLPVVALAVIFQKNPNVFFWLKDSVKNVQDWENKTIAVFYGYDHEYMYKAILDSFKINRKTITEVPVTPDMGRFFKGEVQVWGGYKINQPLTAKEKGFEIVTLDPDTLGLDVPGDVLFTSEKMVKENPELVQNVVNCVLSGWIEALKNSEKAIMTVKKYQTNFNYKHEKQMMDEIQKLVINENKPEKFGWMYDEKWQKIIQIWKKYGGIKKEVKTEECFNNNFVINYYKDHDPQN